MGLKTTNYTVSKLGITIPEAYAMIDRMTVEKSSVRVRFSIQSTRENTKKLAPIETVEMHFVWDRQSDLAKTAYAEAKALREEKQLNEETKQMETIFVAAPFYGWEDDIQTE